METGIDYLKKPCYSLTHLKSIKPILNKCLKYWEPLSVQRDPSADKLVDRGQFCMKLSPTDPARQVDYDWIRARCSILNRDMDKIKITRFLSRLTGFNGSVASVIRKRCTIVKELVLGDRMYMWIRLGPHEVCSYSLISNHNTDFAIVRRKAYARGLMKMFVCINYICAGVVYFTPRDSYNSYDLGGPTNLAYPRVVRRIQTFLSSSNFSGHHVPNADQPGFKISFGLLVVNDTSSLDKVMTFIKSKVKAISNNYEQERKIDKEVKVTGKDPRMFPQLLEAAAALKNIFPETCSTIHTVKKDDDEMSPVHRKISELLLLGKIEIVQKKATLPLSLLDTLVIKSVDPVQLLKRYHFAPIYHPLDKHVIALAKNFKVRIKPYGDVFRIPQT